MAAACLFLSKTAAPVHSLGNDQVASTIPVRQGMTKPGIAGNGTPWSKETLSTPLHFVLAWMWLRLSASMASLPLPFIPASSSGSMALPPMAVATVGSPVRRGSVTGSGSYEVRRGIH
jgi:lipoprotein NlpD